MNQPVQSHPKPLYKQNVNTDVEVAGADELLHIYLQISSSLEHKKIVAPLG